MRLKSVTENGNVAALYPQDVVSHNNINNRSWLSNNISSNDIYEYDNVVRTSNSQFNSCNTYDKGENIGSNNESINIDNYRFNNSTDEVCNRQYRINNENNINILNSFNNKRTGNLEGITESSIASRESYLDNSNASSVNTPLDEERAFENSDTDEMSVQSIHPVPRGIVNPNYPGFQHLAHTLQDYSANIDSFYHSENEMTDDDVDLEITESSNGYELKESVLECKRIKINNDSNGNENSELSDQTLLFKTDLLTENSVINSPQNDIPDLLKTISKNNNNINTNLNEYELSCTEADIENNFHTKDIIGDFNKEIEDEIKQLLNYNINIQDDLEELRKDIQDTFAKPIENTINNISDVVNHVIKKLVENQNDIPDQTNLISNDSSTNLTKDVDDAIEENTTNTKTEMNLSRPTFLLIESNNDEKIPDAFLSDAKDEININYENEYDPSTLSNNVERTIQQLSTELRKIIPKLEEMRENDRIWNEHRSHLDIESVIKDGNSNEISDTSQRFIFPSPVNSEYKSDISRKPGTQTADQVIRKALVARIEPQAPRGRPKQLTPTKSFWGAQNKSSVRKSERAKDCDLGSFDVYNIETALPKLDLDAIESHLKAAKEAERRKRNDREEIRKRLAMGAETEEFYSMGHIDRPGRKPSLHSRLQNGKNLQICFMNEIASDNESQASDVEKNLNSTKSLSRSSIFQKSNFNNPYQTRPLSVNITKHDKIGVVQTGTKLRPPSFTAKTPKSRSAHSLGHIEIKESDFYALQATLQTEARIALAQAKEMARIQMERERRSRPVSPVTEMLRRSMEKASAPLAADRRRVSRQLLTDMNIAQLQVIVNELHGQIEGLNEQLVQLLMARDDLHMGQDSMLVDIEDLTRYLGVKEQTKKTKGSSKSGVRRLASLVHKT